MLALCLAAACEPPPRQDAVLHEDGRLSICRPMDIGLWARPDSRVAGHIFGVTLTVNLSHFGDSPLTVFDEFLYIADFDGALADEPLAVSRVPARVESTYLNQRVHLRLHDGEGGRSPFGARVPVRFVALGLVEGGGGCRYDASGILEINSEGSMRDQWWTDNGTIQLHGLDDDVARRQWERLESEIVRAFSPTFSQK